MTHNMASIEEKAGIGDRQYYEKYYGRRPPEQYLWLLSDVIRYGSPGNILDLGCGVGLFVELANSWGLQVRGCDGSPDAVRMGLQRNSKSDLFHCQFSDPLPFGDSTVDNVVLNEVIEHLPPRIFLNVLSECKRILKRGGVVFICSPNKANKGEILRDPTHVNPLYPSELRGLLLSNGFKILAEPGSARFFTRSVLLSRLLRSLMKTGLREWLSATTNAYARKM